MEPNTLPDRPSCQLAANTFLKYAPLYILEKHSVSQPFLSMQDSPLKDFSANHLITAIMGSSRI